MSYAGEVREELATLFVKKTCCRRAQLWGFLLFAAAPDGTVRYLTHSRAIVQMISALLSDIQNLQETDSPENRSLSENISNFIQSKQNREGQNRLPHTVESVSGFSAHGDTNKDSDTNRSLKKYSSPNHANDIAGNERAPLGPNQQRESPPPFRLTWNASDIEHLRTSCHISKDSLLPVFGCDKCAAAFLRGAFLSCGNVTDPLHAYHLDFTLNDETTAPVLCAALQLSGLEAPHRFCRKGQTVLYYKTSSNIEDFLAYLGATRSVFSLMDAKIYKEIRNDTNRRQNFDLANLSKAVSKAQAHLWAIEVLRQAGKLPLLPEQLQTTARLRTEFPDLPLADLAAAHDPPLTKSGLNHRLHKLLQLAKELQTEPETKKCP